MQGFRKINETWIIQVLDPNSKESTLVVDPDKPLMEYFGGRRCYSLYDITYNNQRVAAHKPIRSFYKLQLREKIIFSYRERRYPWGLAQLYGCPSASDRPGLVPSCMLNVFEGFEQYEY